MSNKSLFKLILLALLSAMIFVFFNVPMKIGVIEMAVAAIIPVAVGAIVLGPLAGLFLGTVFGLASFLQCIGIFIPSAFGILLFEINPFYAVLICFLPRMIMGLSAGLIFKALSKIDRTKTVSFLVASLSTAVVNTVLFMSVLMICYYPTDRFQDVIKGYGVTGFWATVIFIAGVNAIIEAVSCCVLGGAVSKAIYKIQETRKS